MSPEKEKQTREEHWQNWRERQKRLAKITLMGAELPNRVRLLPKPDGTYQPARLTEIRRAKIPRTARAGPVVERQEAQRIIDERREAALRAALQREPGVEPPKPPEFLATFETAMKYIQALHENAEEKALWYCTQNGEDRADLLEPVTEILMGTSPTHIMSEHPLAYLSQPLVLTEQGAWEEIRNLTEAAHPFHSFRGILTEPYIGSTIKEDYRFLGEAILRWTTEEKPQSKEPKFTPETVIAFFRSLARIRDADCTYFGRMYFPGEIPPQTFISNLATLYEKTVEYLKAAANPKIETIVNTLQEEAQLLRVIEVQEYEFVTYDRPTDYRVALLPMATYLTQAIKKDLEEGRPVNYELYADQVMGAFRSRRCGLRNEDIFGICSFLSGKVLPEELAASQNHHHMPWLILDLENRGAAFDQRSAALKQEPGAELLTPPACSALASIDLEPSVTSPIVPELLKAFRKMGYLDGITEEDYQYLGLPPELWNHHQKILTEAKPPLQINQGDIVVFVPLSGWSITNAHLESARAARYIGRQLIQLQEIKRGQPILERGVKVVFTFGMFARKVDEGMPEVPVRSDLGEKAVSRQDDLYVVPPGLIDEYQERSNRIKQLMAYYSKTYGVSWSLPGEGCIAIILGGTEKLGLNPDRSRATQYQFQKDSPTEDLDFLNGMPQIFGLLEQDIEHPSIMTHLIVGLLRDFDRQGVAIMATHFPELHSSKAAESAEDWLKIVLREKGGEAVEKLSLALSRSAPAADQQEAWDWLDTTGRSLDATRKLQLAFSTMVPPLVREEAWRMILKRAYRKRQ